MNIISFIFPSCWLTQMDFLVLANFIRRVRTLGLGTLFARCWLLFCISLDWFWDCALPSLMKYYHSSVAREDRVTF